MASTTWESFFEEHPSIKHYNPASTDFDAIRATYVIQATNKPSNIARPQTAEDVSALVTYCVANSEPFVIRSGGHDLSGRSTVSGILQIDMRDIDYVTVNPDMKTARIGGGILQGKLLAELDAQGLMTATGSVATVGFVGWATLGGYGPFSPSLGLGCDQIVGAKVVNSEGSIVEASERMLKGLRGAGGNFGVVIELTIRVYPAQEVQAGMILFDSSSMESTIRTYFANFSKLLESTTLPTKLYLQPLSFTIPNMGKTFAVCFVWAGVLDDEVKEWQDRISSLAPVTFATVKPTTALGYVSEVTSVVPLQVHNGKSQTTSHRGLALSPSAIDALAKHVALQPGAGTLASFHCLHGISTKSPFPDSVFRNRDTHLMLEIVGTTVELDSEKEGRKWADGFVREMKEVEGVMEARYVSLTPEDEVDLEIVYGENLGEVRGLKLEFDPGNVFKYAVPRF